jgi:hypothetical protein
VVSKEVDWMENVLVVVFGIVDVAEVHIVGIIGTCSQKMKPP